MTDIFLRLLIKLSVFFLTCPSSDVDFKWISGVCWPMSSSEILTAVPPCLAPVEQSWSSQTSASPLLIVASVLSLYSFEAYFWGSSDLFAVLILLFRNWKVLLNISFP